LNSLEGLPSSKYKILVIDDDPTNLLLISHYLSVESVTVLTALNGEAGLETARQQRPDLILLDIQMPVMDGFAVCNEIKSDASISDTPVIFMTALSGQENRIKGFELGAVDYIIKPVIRQELLARINVQLKMRSLMRDLQSANASMEILVKKRTQELENAIQEQKRNNRFNSQVIDSINAGVVIYGPDHKYRYFNRFMERVSGFSVDEVLGKTIFDIFPSSREGVVAQALDAAWKGEDPEAFDFYAAFSSTWLSIKYSPVRDENGNVVGVIGIDSDITERKLFEDKLLKFSMIVEQLPETVVITDASGTIEYVNPRFTELTGYSSLEAIGQNPRILKSGQMPEGLYCELWETISAGLTWKGEMLNRKKNGDLFWEHATIAPFKDSDGRLKGFIAIKQDITSQKQLQLQLEQSQKMEAVGLLAGGIAHDFNNILTVIQGFSTLLQMDLDKDGPHQENINEIISAAERASELTGSLLAFSRKQLLNISRIEINEAVKDVAKLLRRVIGEDIRLELNCWGEPLYVDADRTQISQVLINLATNARDAMPHGGCLRVTLERVLSSELAHILPITPLRNEYVLLKVSDSGIGIDKEALDKIFEPFFTSKKTDKGTGLGLSIVYGIVTQHNGHIRVESNPGMGATFYVYLPVSRGEGLEKQADNKLAQAARGEETILVADDEAAARNFLFKLLTRYGYQVILAADGVEAVRMFEDKQESVDMVLLDVMMPGISGKEAYDRMLLIRPELKALFLSGYDAGLLQKKYEMKEDFELLGKPVHAHVLLDKIREILDR
jgi:PAS domain S-box-containing protein